MQKKEKFRTYENVFDESTLRTLFKLSSKGYFEELESPISVGKEANVFSAKTKDKEKVVVKIYRVNSADFHKMYNYIAADPRFKGLMKKRRKIIYAWAQREYSNLLLVREAEVAAPKPIAFSNNVLIMEYIGKKQPAPKLKNKKPKDIKKFYKEIEENMKKLEKKGLIHGDLSEYNILNDNDHPVFIDFSHGIKDNYPNAEELKERDRRTIQNYARRNGISI